MRNITIVLLLLSGSLAFCQPSTGTVKQAGSCNAANTGSNGQVTITCSGIGKEQGDKIIKLLQTILASQNADLREQMLIRAQASVSEPIAQQSSGASSPNVVGNGTTVNYVSNLPTPPLSPLPDSQVAELAKRHGALFYNVQ